MLEMLVTKLTKRPALVWPQQYCTRARSSRNAPSGRHELSLQSAQELRFGQSIAGEPRWDVSSVRP